MCRLDGNLPGPRNSPDKMTEARRLAFEEQKITTAARNKEAFQAKKAKK